MLQVRVGYAFYRRDMQGGLVFSSYPKRGSRFRIRTSLLILESLNRGVWLKTDRLNYTKVQIKAISFVHLPNDKSIDSNGTFPNLLEHWNNSEKSQKIRLHSPQCLYYIYADLYASSLPAEANQITYTKLNKQRRMWNLDRTLYFHNKSIFIWLQKFKTE